MPTITIDGVECEFEPGASILDVAKANGVEIPHYCYHEGLSVPASCRICLAEVWAPNPRNDGKIEPIPRLMPTCQTTCGDAQVVHTNSPKAIANQKSVMELLLINHPLDCPICDQAGECSLQDYSYQYGRSESRFEEAKIKQPKKDLGSTVYLYSDRCIMCTRCVRFTREVSGTGELYVDGRGSQEQIDLFPGMALENELSGNVVDICPVGALLDKDFQFQQRVWFLTETPSIDGLTASGDNLWVHHNEGVVYRMKPRTNLKVNKWWISDEIRYGWKFVHSDDRLTGPKREQQGNLTQTTLANAYEAANAIMSGAKKAGSKIAVLASPMISCEEAYLAAKYAGFWCADTAEVILGVGPVPIDGDDKTFPPNAKPDDAKAYTIRAEKAPNARGVRRVLTACNGGNAPHEFEEWLVAAKSAEVVIITGNYPNAWATSELTKAVGRKTILLFDTLTNDLVKKATIVLPASTWVEKSGTFENVNGLLQTFARAIDPIEGTRPEGQMFWDLLAIAEGGVHSASPNFDAAAVRQEMAEVIGLTEFVDGLEESPASRTVLSDMELVEL